MTIVMLCVSLRHTQRHVVLDGPGEQNCVARVEGRAANYYTNGTGITFSKKLTK